MKAAELQSKLPSDAIGGEMMEHSSNVLFSIGPVEITGVVVTMWVIIALLALLSWLATRNMKDVPGTLQNLAEIAVSKLQNYFEGILGPHLGKKYFPILATLFIFIIVSNYAGLLPGAGHIKGFSVPTASLSVTAGLAIIGFFAIHTIGVKERGALGYFKELSQRDAAADFGGDLCAAFLSGPASFRQPVRRGDGHGAALRNFSHTSARAYERAEPAVLYDTGAGVYNAAEHLYSRSSGRRIICRV